MYCGFINFRGYQFSWNAENLLRIFFFVFFTISVFKAYLKMYFATQENWYQTKNYESTVTLKQISMIKV